MKVKDVLEALNGLPSEEMVAIQWYTKDDIELNLQRKITREENEREEINCVLNKLE